MITVSIVSHGQMALVDALLADLARLSSHHLADVIVTRNVPERAPAPTSDRLTVTLIDNPSRKGFGANHNAAFARAEAMNAAPHFAILNPDLRLEADPFGALLQRFDRDDERLALTAPTIVSREGRVEDAARRWLTPWSLVRRRLFGLDHDAVARPDWVAGMFMLVRTDVFRAVHGFDERYFLYCEDADLCARLALGGWRFAVVDDAVAIHDARRDSHASSRHLRWHLESLAKLWTSSTFWRYRRLLAQRRPA